MKRFFGKLFFCFLFLVIFFSLKRPYLIVNGFINPSTQWNLINVNTEEAWNFTQGNSDITIAIIDSGIDFTHPDLVNQSWINRDELSGNGKDDDSNGYIDDVSGWDFRDGDNDPSPGHEHGTFVAGLIAADDDGHLMVGIAPGIKIMNIRFLDDSNSFSGSDWGMFTEAVNYAVENGADIIHMSIQANGIPPSDFYNSLKSAYEQGVIIVSVTGNNQDHVTYPGNYSEVIAVSATTQSQSIASFSSPGDQNEICAPGADVYSIEPGTLSLRTGSGTSFAAPLVSGTIGLMKSLNKDLSTDKIREILHNTSTDLGEVGKDPIFGYGLLNACKALEEVPYTNYNISTTTFSTQTTTQVKFIIYDSPTLVLTIVIISVLKLRKADKEKLT